MAFCPMSSLQEEIRSEITFFCCVFDWFIFEEAKTILKVQSAFQLRAQQ